MIRKDFKHRLGQAWGKCTGRIDQVGMRQHRLGACMTNLMPEHKLGGHFRQRGPMMPKRALVSPLQDSLVHEDADCTRVVGWGQIAIRGASVSGIKNNGWAHGQPRDMQISIRGDVLDASQQTGEAVG